MRPYQKGQQRNGKHGCDHGHISEYRFACIDRHYLRYQSERGQDNDIYFRVSQEPEQMLVQNGASAFVREYLGAAYYDIRQVEAGAQVPVEQE